MKPLLIPFLLVLALCTTSLAKDEKNIQAKDAAQYVGQEVVVSGTIADIHQFKGGSIVIEPILYNTFIVRVNLLTLSSLSLHLLL